MSRIPGTRVFFSPRGGISKELSRMIKAARGDIAVAAYAFSSKYLGQALSEALKRGVKVRIILDGEIARKAYSIDEWLFGEGIDLRFIDVKGGCLHHKFMIIDGKILMTGSYLCGAPHNRLNAESIVMLSPLSAGSVNRSC